MRAPQPPTSERLTGASASSLSCAILPGTNFARRRYGYRPRRGNRGALLGKAEP
jgi:hypothetical protein